MKFENYSAGKYKNGDEHFMAVDGLCNVANLFVGVVDQLDKSALKKYGLSTAE